MRGVNANCSRDLERDLKQRCVVKHSIANINGWRSAGTIPPTPFMPFFLILQLPACLLATTFHEINFFFVLLIFFPSPNFPFMSDYLNSFSFPTDRPCTRCVKRNMAEKCIEGHRKKAKYLLDDAELGE